ncbi:secreted protein [Rhodopirellula maiorica SM1]|uniref:Secreted protein n=1 Tax=Rhodopirellula maiorica SM1 TaxID=1265738 RepID=M5RBV5_9BACT|nr:secreted protein [Rhodopirellula maiorica SM1]
MLRPKVPRPLAIPLMAIPPLPALGMLFPALPVPGRPVATASKLIAKELRKRSQGTTGTVSSVESVNESWQRVSVGSGLAQTL